MKKKLLSALVIALIISSVISISMFLLEGISAYTTGRMPIYHTVWGGEYGEDVGIGWSIGTTYPMSTPGQQVHSTVRVFPNTTIIPFFLIIWAVIFAVAFIIKGGKKALIILAVSSAGIACVTGIVIGVKRGIGGWLDKPKEIYKIEIATGAYNVDNITYLEYRQKGKDVNKTTALVRRLNPAENGRYAYFDTENLNIDSDYITSKAQARKLEKYMRKLSKEDDEIAYSHEDKELAYYIEITFIDNNGKYDRHSLRGYNEYTESWPEFAALINDIVGEEYLLANPDFIDKDPDNIAQILGISEADMPEGGSIEGFYKSRRINNINIWGADYNGKIQSIAEELAKYRELCETSD